MPNLFNEPLLHFPLFRALMAFAILGIGGLILTTPLTLLSAFLTWVMRKINIVDAVTHRSSHTTPLPRAGGVAIVVTFFSLPLGIWGWTGAHPFPCMGAIFAFGIGLLILSGAGLWDDIRPLSPRLKMGAQLVFAGFGLYGLFSLGDFGEWSMMSLLLTSLLTTAWLLLAVNTFNFMDGLDGLVSGSTLISLPAIAFMLWVLKDVNHFSLELEVYGFILPFLVFLLLGPATLGFFVWNFPRARIFMGDVGSQFLGGVWGIVGILLCPAAWSPLAIPLLFLNLFWDVLYTLSRRYIRGERVWEAHREHLYQKLSQTGWKHWQVTFLHMGMVSFQAILLGWPFLPLPQVTHLAPVFLGALSVQIAYTLWVERRWKRHEDLLKA